MPTRAAVYKASDSERDYQNWKYTDPSDPSKPNPLTIGEFLLNIHVQLAKAAALWSIERKPELKTLELVRKVLALVVNCAEQHGMLPRTAEKRGELSPLSRQDSYKVIDGERDYQADRPALTIGDSILHMLEYLTYARRACIHQPVPSVDALDNMRKIAALAVACMEQHGAPLRKMPKKVPQRHVPPRVPAKKRATAKKPARRLSRHGPPSKHGI